MVLTGTLAITVHRIDVTLPPAADDKPQAPKDHNIKFLIGGVEKHTKYSKGHHDADVEQKLNFELVNVDEAEGAVLEIHTHNKNKKPLIVNKLPLATFIDGMSEKTITFTSGHEKPTVVKVFISAVWSPKDAPPKTAAPVGVSEPQTSLAVYEAHRPWFARVSYYYDTTKNVYSYTTSFRVVSKLARFGESSANVVLQKVSGKSLHDIDQQYLVPVLDTLDNKVDATISTVVTKLLAGQQYVLKKKDDVVDTASIVASKGTSSVSAVVGTTVSGVVKVKDYTTTQVVNASSAAYSTVVTVKDYTTTQVVNVSSSTYGTVKGATFYVLSHVPYLGTKIRA
ncbi:hypothetical protein FI667_g14419, partial [Globisporangium splendens]